MECGKDDWVCEVLSTAGVRSLRIAVIVVAGLILARVGARLAIRAVQSLATRAPVSGSTARVQLRAKTMSGVVGNGVRVLVWSVVVLTVVDEFGVNLGPLLAGASIAGVAIGFGAQSLVRDFVSGFFVLVEDQFGVGDTITIADTTGTVEDVNLRVTRLRAADGTVWYVPNGEIRKVGNAAKEWTKALVDIVVPPGVDLARVSAAVTDEIAAMASAPPWSEAIVEPPEYLGIEVLAADGVTVRVSAKTAPAQRAGVVRELRSRIVARLRREGLLTFVAGQPGVSD